MKKRLIGVCAVLVLVGGSLGLVAGDVPTAKQGSPEFERMKSLVGSWQGRTDIGQGPIDINVQYRLLAAGRSVLPAQ